MTHVKLLAFQGDSNLGLYGYANDAFGIVGRSVTEEDAKIVSDVLQVPVHRMNVLGTGLAGVFLAGTAKVMFAPDVMFDIEKAELQKICDTHKTKLIFVQTIHTALGNNIVVGEKIIYASTDFEEEDVQFFTDQGFEVKQLDIAQTTVVGSSLMITAKGGLIHPQVDQEMGEQIEKDLGITLHQGSANGGSPYVRSGIIANTKGFVMGELSSGPEVTNADEAFGFLDNE